MKLSLTQTPDGWIIQGDPGTAAGPVRFRFELDATGKALLAWHFEVLTPPAPNPRTPNPKPAGDPGGCHECEPEKPLTS